GLYQAAMASRFVDELPADHVDVIEAKSPFGGVYANLGRSNPFGRSRFDEQPQASYQTPGWQRAQQRWSSPSGQSQRPSRGPLTIDGELVASSTGREASYVVGDRVLHQKFGPGRVTEVDGNKLTIEFERAGRKRVVDSFVERMAG
ncbi:MAG TPA: ATP-dependent DNA helicase, partial [Hyphomicrobiaceae bacterium]|nr:ATP-dependent DNA helicase [Hyphomicrobiaceae bacterium]